VPKDFEYKEYDNESEYSRDYLEKNATKGKHWTCENHLQI